MSSRQRDLLKFIYGMRDNVGQPFSGDHELSIECVYGEREGVCVWGGGRGGGGQRTKSHI